MADEKLNTGPGEEKLPEAPASVTADGPQTPAPEQAAAPTPQQEGPAQPEPGDVVVSFAKINELMGEKRQAARAEVEKAEAGKHEKEAPADQPTAPRRGRQPKEEKTAPADKAEAKPRKSILISCGARLAPFDIPQLREVMAYDELELDRIGDRKTAVLQLRGLPPFYSPKYDLKKHPNYRYTAEADKKKNAFDLDRLINRKRRPGPDELCEVYAVAVPDDGLTSEDEDVLNYDDIDDPDAFA